MSAPQHEPVAEKALRARRRRARAVALVLLLLVVAAVVATLVVRRDRDDATLVRVVVAERTTITSRVLAQGRLRAKQQVEVSSEVSGRVIAVFVREGDVVKPGDPLFAIDDEQQRNVVAQLEVAARATRTVVERATLMLDEARRQLERDAKLKERGALPDDTFLTARNRVPLAEADLTSAKTQAERAALDLARARDALKKTRVAAPLAGTVVAVDIDVGEVVVAGLASSSSGAAMGGFSGLGASSLSSSSSGVVIADLGELVAELDVDELDIGLVKEGQTVALRAQSGGSFTGRVARTGLLGRDSAGAVTFDVDVDVLAPADAASDAGPEETAAPGPRLRPGMSVTGDIEVETMADVVAVPIAAVLEGTGDDPDRVLVVETALAGDGARFVSVTLGPQDAEHVAVLAGVEPGARVVEGPFRALKELKDGDPVRVDVSRKLHEQAATSASDERR